jgi:DNA-binding transcriptional ArsR family regulator
MNKSYTALFKALSDITRQKILELLKQNSMNVTEICQAFKRMSQPTISHHLQILKNCELVNTRKQGKMIYYTINKEIVRDELIKFFNRIEVRIKYCN